MTNRYFDTSSLYGASQRQRGPFADLLEYEPRGTYLSHVGDQGFNQSQSQALRGQFSRVQDDFLAKQYSMIRSGGAPTLRFDDYLGGTDFSKLYNSLTPYQQGKSNRSLYAPSARYLFNY